jgi:hypothetical protein
MVWAGPLLCLSSSHHNCTADKRKQSYVILQLFKGITEAQVWLHNDRFEATHSRAGEEGVSRESFERMFPQVKFAYTYP